MPPYHKQALLVQGTKDQELAWQKKNSIVVGMAVGKNSFHVVACEASAIRDPYAAALVVLV